MPSTRRTHNFLLMIGAILKPSNVDLGRVEGRFIVGIEDGTDVGDEPDFIAAMGTIEFTASVPYLPDPTASPAPVTLLKTTIRGMLDGEGYLCAIRRGVVNGKEVDAPGPRGMSLVATDDPDLLVQNWTWNVTYRFTAVNGSTPSIPAHGIAVPMGATVDLTTTLKVPSSPGYGLPQSEAAVLRAEAAALDIATTANETLAEASGYASDAESAKDTAVAAAAEATAPTDAMVAGKINTPGSLIETALTAAIDEQATVIAEDVFRPGEMGAALGNALASRPKLGTDVPTVAYTLAQPIAGGVRVAHDTAGALADVAFIGGYPLNPNDGLGNRVRNGIGQEAPYGMEFDFTGTDLAFELRSMSGIPVYRFWVDGAMLSRAPNAPSITLTAGQIHHGRLTFSVARKRRIRIDINNAEFRGIWKASADALLKPPSITAPKKVAFSGDSYTHGASPVGPMNTFPWLVGQILGLDAAQAGEGGTGYTTAGSVGNRTVFGSAARLARIAGYAPDYLVVFGSVNDKSATSAAVQSAAAALYADVASLMPTVSIIVFGVQPRNSVIPAVDRANNAAVKAAADAAPNVVAFIDTIGEKVFTGTGNYTSPKGDGNADFVLGGDGVHPTLIGHEYLARWVSAHLSLHIT